MTTAATMIQPIRWTSTVILGAVGLLLAAFGSACQTDPEPIAVLVTPAYASLGAGSVQDFTAAIAFDPSNRGVTWELTGCTGGAAVCGSLSNVTGSSATYTAPAIKSYVAVYVTARSVADDSKSSTATVTVGTLGRCPRC